MSAVISDLTMPGMTGLELAAKLSAIRPGTPVIIASGYLPAETQRRAKELFVRSMISKPFEVQELAVRLGEIVGG